MNDSKEDYKYWKKKYFNLKKVLDKLDKIACNKHIRTVAVMLLKKDKDDQYMCLMLTRSGDEKLMTPGGGVQVFDVYDHKGNYKKGSCFKALKREFQEEVNAKFPEVNIINSITFRKETKIYICEMLSELDLSSFKKNDEVIKVQWIPLKDLVNDTTDVKLVRYVRASIDEMHQNNLFEKFL